MKPEESRKRGAPPFKANWAEVDWDLPNATLAREYKVSTSTIDRNRLRFGHPRRQKLIDWTTVDWDKSNAVLCRKLGVTTAAKYRRIYAPETIPSPNHSLAEIDWETVDWDMRTGKLAKHLGVKRNRLYDLRCQYAPHTVARRRKIPDDLNLDWDLPNHELARQHNLCIDSVRLRRKTHAPHTVKPKCDWASIDWHNLSNPEIELQTGASWPTIHKYRQIHAPETVRSGPGRPSNSKNVTHKAKRWTSVDWQNLSNAEIIAQTKASLPTVIKYRRIHAPETLRNGRAKRKKPM